QRPSLGRSRVVAPLCPGGDGVLDGAAQLARDVVALLWRELLGDGVVVSVGDVSHRMAFPVNDAVAVVRVRTPTVSAVWTTQSSQSPSAHMSVRRHFGARSFGLS